MSQSKMLMGLDNTGYSSHARSIQNYTAKVLKAQGCTVDLYLGFTEEAMLHSQKC